MAQGTVLGWMPNTLGPPCPTGGGRLAWAGGSLICTHRCRVWLPPSGGPRRWGHRLGSEDRGPALFSPHTDLWAKAPRLGAVIQSWHSLPVTWDHHSTLARELMGWGVWATAPRGWMGKGPLA